MSFSFADMKAVEEQTRLIMNTIEAAGFESKAIAVIGDYEYQGLDIRAIIRAIYQRGTAAGRSADQIRDDIWRMALLFLCRGNNIEKMMARSKDDTAAAIRIFKTTYQLQDKVGRGGADRVTLSRVAAVFPGVTLALLANDKISKFIPRAVSLSSGDFGSDFPKVMQTVIVAAIFPKGDEGISLMKALLLYMIEENKLLSKNTSTQGDEAILTEVIKYAKASFMSTVLALKDRVEISTKYGILVNEKVAANIVPARQTFDRKHPNVDFTFMK